MKYLSLNVGGENIQVSGIPTGGWDTTGQAILRLGVNLLFFIAIILAFLVFIYAGFRWLTSAGDEKKITQAEHAIIFAIVGLVIVLCSFIAVSVIGNFFNINLVGFP